MKIGVPKEIKVHEYRVGLVADDVRTLVAAGHEVFVETGAGAGIGLTDADYRNAGATIADSPAEIFEPAELIIKVKEPQPSEVTRLRRGQILFTYLHLAADPALTDALCASGATSIAYETVTADDGSLPLLQPMSAVAGRMSIQVGAHCLQKSSGGSGILLGGVSGVSPARVVVIGGGVAGSHALQMALGLQADVTILDRSPERLAVLIAQFGERLHTIVSTPESIGPLVTGADLVVGAVLIPGDAAPKLITRRMVRDMRPGSVIVDISIDQGGCAETSRPTTHAEPTYIVDDIVHYCVTNIPGAVPRTSTLALTHATLPFIRALADQGLDRAIATDPHLANGINVHDGTIRHPAVRHARAAATA